MVKNNISIIKFSREIFMLYKMTKNYNNNNNIFFL